MENKSVAGGNFAKELTIGRIKEVLVSGLGFVGFDSRREDKRSGVKSSELALSDISKTDGTLREGVAVVVLDDAPRETTKLEISEGVFSIADELEILPNTTVGIAISLNDLDAASLCPDDLVKAGAILVYDMSAKALGSDEGEEHSKEEASGALFAPGAFFVYDKPHLSVVGTSRVVWLRYGYCDAFDSYIEAEECTDILHNTCGHLREELAKRQGETLQGGQDKTGSVFSGVLRGLTFSGFDDVFSEDDMLQIARQWCFSLPFGLKRLRNLHQSYLSQIVSWSAEYETRPDNSKTFRVKAAEAMARELQIAYPFLLKKLEERSKGEDLPSTDVFFDTIVEIVAGSSNEKLGSKEVVQYVETLGKKIGLKALHEANLKGASWEDLEGVLGG